MKDFLLRQAGKRYKSMDWIKCNKTLIGLIFFYAAGYVYTFSCPGLDSPTCSKLTIILTHLASFLTGAGLLPSDYREKFVQLTPDAKVKEIEKLKNGN